MDKAVDLKSVDNSVASQEDISYEVKIVMESLRETVVRNVQVQFIMDSIVEMVVAHQTSPRSSKIDGSNRFTVGGIPIEVRAPEQSKRHGLVRNSTARIDNVNELNTRWPASGPPSVTTAKRRRLAKMNGERHQFDEPTADLAEERKAVPTHYARHLAKQKRQRRALKLVELQQRNGSKGLDNLWKAVRQHSSPFGVVHMERPLIHMLCHCFDDESSNHAALLGGALALEALVKDPKIHIEVRARKILESAAGVAQRTDLLTGRDPGAGWRIMRALVASVGRLTEDAERGRPHKHNRQFCIDQGALVILVHAMASDILIKVHRQSKNKKQTSQSSCMIPQWNASTSRRTKKLDSHSNSTNEDVNLEVIHEMTHRRPSTVPPKATRRGRLSKNKLNKSMSKSMRPKTRSSHRKGKKPSKRELDRDLKTIKRQTQIDAIRILQVWATEKSLRHILAVGRVLEAALLISGGRKHQLLQIDNDGNGRPLTMGRPKYKGTEIQRAANRLLMTFKQRDFEAMESADRRRAIGQFAEDADKKLSSILRLSGEKSSSMNLHGDFRGNERISRPKTNHAQSHPHSMPSRVPTRRPHTVAVQSISSLSAGEFPSMPSSVANLSGTSMASDGDRSKRQVLKVPVWEAFRDAMVSEDVRTRVRELWREEIHYRAILDDRDKRLASALIRSRKQNLRHSKLKVKLNRQARIERLCTPEGRMEEARRRYGLDWKDPSENWEKVDPRVRRKLLGLDPPEPAKPKPLIYHRVPEQEPQPEPQPHIARPDYFGSCADDGGRAWWENLLVKKKHPTREDLAKLPYDISKDVEDSTYAFAGQRAGLEGDALPMANGFLPFIGQQVEIKHEINSHETGVSDNQELRRDIKNTNELRLSGRDETKASRPWTAATKPESLTQQKFIPVLRPSSAPALESQQHP